MVPIELGRGDVFEVWYQQDDEQNRRPHDGRDDEEPDRPSYGSLSGRCRVDSRPGLQATSCVSQNGHPLTTELEMTQSDPNLTPWLIS